jgi:putative DNA primase/helicase
MGTIQDKMLEFGITPPTTIIHDGAIHRFKNDGDDNKNSWYVAYDNDKFQSGAFGCWKLDISEKFCSIEQTHLTTEQKQQHAKQLAEQKRIAQLEKITQQDYVQEQVNERFNRAVIQDINAHPYLQKKGVSSHGLRMESSLLLIPMFNIDGEIASVQTISKDGSKFFTKGGRIKGCFLPIGAPKDTLILCEGYATGASIYEATSEPVAVCFNSGNIMEVAKELSAKYPDAKIIIAGDDDHKLEKNIGRVKAIEAAKHIGATPVFPVFKISYDENCSDFNDLHRLCGLKEVSKQIYKAIYDSERSVNNGSFVFYDSFYKSMKHLDCAGKSEFIQAVCEYGLFKKQTKLSPHIEGYFELVKPQLDANIRKRKNGNKGGRPPGS